MSGNFWNRPGLYALSVAAACCLAASPSFARQSSQQSSQQTAQQQDNSQQPTGDPIVDAARKAREQKKEAPKPKKVYTNEDVGGTAPPPPAQGASGAGSQAGHKASGADSAVPANPVKSNDAEATWRKRFKDVRTKIALAEKEADVLQRQLDQAQVQYYPDPQKTLEQEYTRSDINDKQTKLDAKKQEIAQLKQQLSDLEDQLRKSGGDAGWARE